jgi:hypothetical protein
MNALSSRVFTNEYAYPEGNRTRTSLLHSFSNFSIAIAEVDQRQDGEIGEPRCALTLKKKKGKVFVSGRTRLHF